MSYGYSNAVWNSFPEIKGGKRLVLLSLCDQSNDSGVCWPSVKYTAQRVSLEPRQVRRLLGELERKHKLIRKDLQKGRNGVNTYTLTFSPEVVTRKTGGDVARDTPGVTPMTPKPSKNHQRTNYSNERKMYYGNRPRTNNEQEIANAF